MKKKISQLTIINQLPIILGLVGLLAAILLIVNASINKKDVNSDINSEITELNKNTRSFDDLRVYFQSLAQKKGAVYAYQVLKTASLPPNTDMHLLGHVVGEVLYQQEGANGMKYCTQDFRNACSHTVAVGLFLDKGEAALSEIAQACEKAPGGKGAYAMCFHGLGHGVLAFTNYNLADAVALCKKTGTKQRNNREYSECVGGIIMEQISGGDHDRNTWEKQRLVNLKTEDPLYPCNSSIIDTSQAKRFCYLYITPHLFDTAGLVTGGVPTEDTIKRAFTFCTQIDPADTAAKESCFGGFGKEFVVLAKNRDIRKIDTISEPEIAKIYSWCSLTESSFGQKECIKYAMNSIYWGGENSRSGAINFCNASFDQELINYCFSELIRSVKMYNDSIEYRKEFCNEIPQKMSSECKSQLL